jgi:hypothetical protein
VPTTTRPLLRKEPCIRQSAARALECIPPSADILIHFGIDMLAKQDMPAAYLPRMEGLRLS